MDSFTQREEIEESELGQGRGLEKEHVSLEGSEVDVFAEIEGGDIPVRVQVRTGNSKLS